MEEGWKAIRKRKKGKKERGDERKKRMKKERKLTLCGSDGNQPSCSTGDPGSIPGSGKYPGEGSGNPFQYSCLRNTMDRGAWRAIIQQVVRVRYDLVTKPPPPQSKYRRNCA